MEYIYFEIHQLSSGTNFIINTKEIKNSNVLLHKPENLNSDGIWSFRTLTKRIDDYLFVDQFWIDLNIYQGNENDYLYNDIMEVKLKLKIK